MKILLYDIETAPSLAYVWGKWKQNIIPDFVQHEGHMLSWAARWLGEDVTHYDAQTRYPALYKRNPLDDSKVAGTLWDLLNEADAVIAHNGKGFDNKVANAAFLRNGLGPPSPYKTIDTLIEARKHFKLPSNRLDEIGKLLHIGQKVQTGGAALWAGCMMGDSKSWQKMIEYNIGDIDLLEKVYYKLRPWMASHPNIGLYRPGETVCGKCGSTDLKKEGFAYTQVSKFQQYSCKSCGGWGRAGVSETDTKERRTLLRPIKG